MRVTRAHIETFWTDILCDFETEISKIYIGNIQICLRGIINFNVNNSFQYDINICSKSLWWSTRVLFEDLI